MKQTEIAVRPVRTKKDYKRTMKIIETQLEYAPGSAEAETLEVLSILADGYEQKHFPIDSPDPIEAIKYKL